ncbi:MAG: hypothetical protein V3S89_06845 [Desulfobacterales bacterium]
MTREEHPRTPAVRTILLILILAGAAGVIQWDRHRIASDRDSVISLLNITWMDAWAKDKRLIVRFGADRITITDGDSGNVITTLKVPTLHSVDYGTTLGDEMIVFTGSGPSVHNERKHGGDLTLRSWFGFKKYIAVNCNGMITEGRPPA